MRQTGRGGKDLVMRLSLAKGRSTTYRSSILAGARRDTAEPYE
jgi:hypothetical protein